MIPVPEPAPVVRLWSLEPFPIRFRPNFGDVSTTGSGNGRRGSPVPAIVARSFARMLFGGLCWPEPAGFRQGLGGSLVSLWKNRALTGVLPRFWPITALTAT
ncbi:hypothetical protein [Rhodospirillum rubrum]|uniref:hypothetical protein n=1 Tax=Rhodospirillum rubrum TaxID=1085 RepID=UPI0011D2292A|nr:hypothetical protein [Rhodospirillum rubrum]QXG80693.1 hypothetical protein KUL73_01025 [Rhodospirillum rubrum]